LSIKIYYKISILLKSITIFNFQ